MQDQELDDLDRVYEEKISKLKTQIDTVSTAISQQKEMNKKELDREQQYLQDSYDSKAKELELQIVELRENNENEIRTEERKFEQFEAVKRDKVKEWEYEKEAIMKKYTLEKEAMSNDIEQQIQVEIEKHKNLCKQKKDLIAKQEEMIDAMEQDAEEEMASETKTFKLIALQERKVALRLREENDITKKKYDALMKDSEEHKETILSLKEKQSELSTSIAGLRKLKLDREQELKKVEKTIKKVDFEINNATEETHKMERCVILVGYWK